MRPHSASRLATGEPGIPSEPKTVGGRVLQKSQLMRMTVDTKAFREGCWLGGSELTRAEGRVGQAFWWCMLMFTGTVVQVKCYINCDLWHRCGAVVPQACAMWTKGNNENWWSRPS